MEACVFIMKHLYYLILIIVFSAVSCKKVITHSSEGENQNFTEDTTNLKNYTKDITVVNWNIEWFGSSAMFKGNLDLQESNAGKVLKYLNADIYGICEVVDTARFGRMIRNTMGDEFRYKISFYPTSIGSQKLAFIYNRNIFRNVSVRPFMGISANAYNYFAQRFPFFLRADVVVNGKRNIVNYILVHAKANADTDSYNRRLKGSKEMKDSLDRYFAGEHTMIIGDFNDRFNGSIVSGQVSPYQNFLSDPNYNAITLPLNSAGYQSSINYANSVIDQQVISSSMTKWYKTSSAKIRTDVSVVIPDYNTGNTSDHYPVSSSFRF